ncbi:MAG: HoxN/HupN/NixA family nickel/cobalt transporter [Actinobacteria bacterium]|jgi:nickel/cobalt transporter (NiCoT) family protein|nr:HoxN/HupN/NixA family nickel/cobalt transporter [Actinomycetota bacterium]NBO51578.1 HoxN/HupN/NixA family nickel/cobalt transporter [Actinomycetota bacterium]NBQ59737.1 HoxN/HupN/NixA family nickel/cobalt transporter [Actinomycetota bacterium]NCU78723.1 HoxN/HupN/NixA family nickel/cobalt transporter [Actinomycetota bacterium]NCV73970.1 HoxN/HupN/NixA family nickel/cobalt transporter [Actinomycetota bacterium]
MSSKTSLREHLRFTREEIPALLGVAFVVIFLHVAGWGLFIHFNSNPAYSSLTDSSGALVYAGAGALAYSFGLRHAFDADHIAAIDDTTRLMLAKGKSPLALGLFFSLGHSTIVLALSIGVAFAAKQAVKFQKDFAETGGIIGASVSTLFLYLVGILNLVILVGIIKVWRQAKTGKFSHEHLTQLLNERGLMRRIFRGAFKNGFDHSWQLYPVGVLFGLGFDTATEVALLALSATAAVGTVGGTLPPLAIIALPLIFAAGMSLMDSLDGIFMTKAYSWAFTSPLRKIYYNITTTGLSIFVAFVIGTIQLIGVLADKTSIDNYQPFTMIAAIDLNKVGYFIVASFVGAWLLSVLVWRLGRYEARYSSGIAETEHEHTEFKI